MSTKAELQAEIDRLHALMDPELGWQELEVKIRAGEVFLRGVGEKEGGSFPMRLFGALMLHMLLGEENEMPPNYRSCEFKLKPAGGFEEIRVVAEVVRPGGESSHEIRSRLEAELAAAKA